MRDNCRNDTELMSCRPMVGRQQSRRLHPLNDFYQPNSDKADRGRGGKTTSGNGQAWSSPSPTGQWRTGKMEETGCEIICDAPVTLAVKGMMMMMMTKQCYRPFCSNTRCSAKKPKKNRKQRSGTQRTTQAP